MDQREIQDICSTWRAKRKFLFPHWMKLMNFSVLKGIPKRKSKILMKKKIVLNLKFKTLL